MPIEKLRPSFSFDEERIKQLKQIVPEAFVDNQVNWEVLKEALGNYLEEDDLDVEHFGLFWPGKREARRMASIPSKGTLVPCPSEGIDEENTRNIFIEGENLEVLKILQKSYAGRIKMIYIDPPYNTGNDFVYDDDFTEPLEEYLRRTGQIDEEGKPLTTNKKSDGRFHSKWLSMMYPRLRLGRNLLKEDGVIFVSIDDNEVQNLKCILNEIFGEENFLGQLIWNQKSGSQAGHFTGSHEYVLCYAKSKDSLPYFSDRSGGNIKHGALKKISRANPASEITFPAGIEFLGDDAVFKGELGGSEKEFILSDKMEFKNGKLAKPVTLKAGWAMRNQVLSWIDGKETLDSKGQKVVKFYFNKQGLLWYEKERGTIHPKTVLPDEVGNTKTGSDEIQKIFGNKVFDFPKPTSLLKYLVDIVIDEDNSIVMDFFAGLCPISQTVNEMNLKGDRKINFLVIQLPEEVQSDSVAAKTHYKNIAEIGLNRIIKSVKLLTKDLDVDNQLFDITEIDLGVKAYKLNKSNYKLWDEYIGDNIVQLQDLFSETEDALMTDWKENNLLTEILLLEGFPLDSGVEEIKGLKKNKVQQATSDFCEHRLIICLDKKVHSDTIKNLQLGDTDIFICLDNAITDEEKVTLSDKGLIKTI
jgi:adenine-specific DNA-methyltransferase